MNFRSTATAILASAAILATTIAPTFAAAPTRTTHLVGNLNPKNLASFGISQESIGHLTYSRYVVVTATGMTGADSMNVTFSNNGIDRTVLLNNDYGALIDFGAGFNTNADPYRATLLTWNPATTNTNLSFEVLDVQQPMSSH